MTALPSSPLAVRGVEVPPFLYGTAWKEEATEELVALALRSGFRGIDTANQRKHYFEAAVGDAIRKSGIDRSALFIQTKFTFRAGQDSRLPYDPAKDIATQVQQSFESSLAHLQTTTLDSYVLHGPSTRRGLAADDWSAWGAMEQLAQAGRTRLLGVSNVSLEQLTLLHRNATVKPAFVQNRCYASTGWDRDVRAFCREHAIVYQGFSLLTANARAMDSKALGTIAERLGRTRAQIVFRFALQLGMLPLTGTTSEEHQREDLACTEFELTDDDVQVVERLG
jgi:diketogulonate reductase-like aldo/keto reductase